jgi:hypothetical protein
MSERGFVFPCIYRGELMANGDLSRDLPTGIAVNI